MDMGLEGRAVLVTGATGGIGRATASAFAAEGARVAVHYRSDREGAERLAEAIGGCAVQGDLTLADQAEAVVGQAAERLGRLDVLVCNAGAWREPTHVWDMTEERFRAVLDQNVMTVFFACRAFLRHVRETGHGDIVLVSSTSALFGEAGNADYAAAKSALTGFALTLKNEIIQIAPRGRVNLVAPGWTVTPAAEAALTEEVAAAATLTMSLKKLATPEEVARAIVWLASPTASTHTSGQIIEVAGGMEGRVVAAGP
jgi:3-oxoacyl-[acyl-carrier protein] reductase